MIAITDCHLFKRSKEISKNIEQVFAFLLCIVYNMKVINYTCLMIYISRKTDFSIEVFNPI